MLFSSLFCIFSPIVPDEANKLNKGAGGCCKNKINGEQYVENFIGSNQAKNPADHKQNEQKINKVNSAESILQDSGYDT